MSAYTEQQTQITDRDILKKCLEEKGYKNVEVHDTPQNLVGYHGDKRQQKAEVIVRRSEIGGSSNDIGFAKQTDGTFAAVISDYDKHKHNATWMADLKKRYAEHKIQKIAKQQGLIFVKKTENPNGGFKLQYVATQNQ